MFGLIRSEPISCQNDYRFSSGLGIEKDVRYNLAFDFNFNILKKTSGFNFGPILGFYYIRFDEPLLATNNQSFFQTGFQAKYGLFDKIWIRADFGSRLPLNSDNYYFNDAMGNRIPDSELKKHNYFSPSLEYAINKAIHLFVIYNFAFENQLDIDTIGMGIIIK